MPTTAPFSCCLTGSAGFTIRCGELLLSRGHPLSVVVSDNPEVSSWAARLGVRVERDFDSLIAGGPAPEFDYLFSVINGVILSREVLALPRRAAVNYHNAPLPRYAGVHAASWAILNGETMHGMTWHRMVERVDAGPIYLQRRFAIDGMASAGEVNDTCRALGLAALDELITELETGRARPAAQDLTRRSYFPGHRKHPSAGLISWDCDAATITRRVGAHSMGPVVNTFGSAKLDLGGRSAVVGAAAQADVPSTGEPGTVVAAGDGFLRVATRTNDVDLMSITDFTGQPMTTGADGRACLPGPGQVLPSVTPAFAEGLAKRLEEISPDEPFCAQLLRAADRTPLPLASADPGQPRTTTTLEYSHAGVNPAVLELATLSAAALGVREATGRDRIPIGKWAMLSPRDRCLDGYLRRGLPVTVDFGARSTVADVLEQVAGQLASTRGHDVYSRDIALRRRLPVAEIPVWAGVGSLPEQDLDGVQLGVAFQAEGGLLRIVSHRRQACGAVSGKALLAFGLRLREWLKICLEQAPPDVFHPS